MDKIKVNLEMCTFVKGVPSGLALINYVETQYEEQVNKYLSFKGIGIFNNGVLHNSPFIFVERSESSGFSLSRLVNGRPAPNSYQTHFNK